MSADIEPGSASQPGPQILDDAITRTVYSTDNSVYQVPPSAIALPRSAAEIGDLLRSNSGRTSPRPIVARGGGTGTNGQSLTDGLMIDIKRHMNQVQAIDPVAMTAVVDPGVVTAELNAQLAQHDLFWAPHTSTLSRATVGGMISTDAAGKGSMIHGRAHRHVLRLEVCLADGTPWVAEPVTVAEAQRRAAEEGPGAALWDRLLSLPIAEGQPFQLPELARGFSGYGIDRFRRDGMVDPTALLCGAEGTLAVITAATLRLTKRPTSQRLVIATYATFRAALDDAVRLRATGPSAIESFDETTLERGRSSPAWPAFQRVVGDHSGAVLLLEFADSDVLDAGLVDIVMAGGSAERVEVEADPAVQAQIWKVRADAVGLLAKMAIGGPELRARPTAFVEDCAVPVEHMPDFIDEFRAVLDTAGLTYGMFGHADVGCVHVRPALDLTSQAHRQLLVSVTDDVTALVTRYGGLLWGEHGRGFRGASVHDVLHDDTLTVMRQVKTAFDPSDLLNPGKLYRPLGSTEPLVRVDQPPLRGATDQMVPMPTRRDFDSAFACNGNGLCHHYSAAEVMCPSYKVTGDPALSPKGRADLIREWLANRRGDADFEDALAKNLHQCLSCSACTGHCPVEVDIPELKSRFFAEYYATGRPLRHRVLSRFEEAAWMAATVPWLTDKLSGVAGQALGLVDLPSPKNRRHRHTRFRAGQTRADVVIMPDVFTGALEADTLHAAIQILEQLGLDVAVARFAGSGKFDHVKGNRERFRRVAERHAALVDEIDQSGAIATVIEPAIALLHHHEYPAIVADYPADRVVSLVQLLSERSDLLRPVGNGTTVTLLGHCTERATKPTELAAWATVLIAAGFKVEAPEVGCCGMAGIFGHESENQEMSRALWERSWEAAIAGSSSGTSGKSPVVAATGYSCRSQASRFDTPGLVHPIRLLLG